MISSCQLIYSVLIFSISLIPLLLWRLPSAGRASKGLRNIIVAFFFRQDGLVTENCQLKTLNCLPAVHRQDSLEIL